MSKNIDEELGRDYVLEDSIEGNNNEIDDTADGDEAFAASLAAVSAAAVETVDLTLLDTDEETEELDLPIARRLRPNKRVYRKLRSKINDDSQVTGISRTVTASASDDDSSVMSRFSANEPPSKKLTKKMTEKKSAKTPAGKRPPTRASNTTSKTTNSKNAKKGKKVPVKDKKLFVNSNCKPLGLAPIITNYSFPTVREELKDVYYLMLFFGDKMLVDKKQYSPKQTESPVERDTTVNGVRYKLCYSKFVTRKGRSYTYEDTSKCTLLCLLLYTTAVQFVWLLFSEPKVLQIVLYWSI
jgi:hypothetical protein